MMLSIVAATTKSMSAFSRSSFFGLMIQLPLFLTILVSETGPLNGMSETDKAADAARHASASGVESSPRDMSVTNT